MKGILNLFFSGLIVITVASGYAQPLRYPFNIPCLQAAPYHASFADAFSSAGNPSVIGEKGFHGGIYAEKKYLTEGLSTIVAGVCYSGNSSGGGLQFAGTGNIYYQELHLAIHYARSLGNVNLACIFRYHVFSLNGYQKSSFPSVGLAMMWKLTDKLHSSVQVINPPLGRLSDKNVEQEAAEYHLGFSFLPSEIVSLNFETIKMEDYLLQVVASVHYKPSPKYLLRAGWSSIGPQPFFGMAWRWKGIRLGVSVTYHPVLGISPGALFQYEPSHPDTP